jgi:hypothetical protein
MLIGLIFLYLSGLFYNDNFNFIYLIPQLFIINKNIFNLSIAIYINILCIITHNYKFFINIYKYCKPKFIKLNFIDKYLLKQKNNLFKYIKTELMILLINNIKKINTKEEHDITNFDEFLGETEIINDKINVNISDELKLFLDVVNKS